MTDRLIEYIQKLEKIRNEKMISKADLCKELSTTYVTLERIFKGEQLAFKTIKKIKNYVDEYELQHGTD